jgi:hypothetical protein
MPVKNICKCPNPPGSTFTCEPHQVGICFVLDGVARPGCHDQPLSGSHADLVDWAVGLITEGRVAFQTREAELLMLSQGHFERPDGTLITFALPESIKSAVATLVGEALKAQVRENEAVSGY